MAKIDTLRCLPSRDGLIGLDVEALSVLLGAEGSLKLVCCRIFHSCVLFCFVGFGWLV